MKRFKLKLIVVLAVCAAFSISVLVVSAASVSYNVSTSTEKATVTNTTSSTRTMAVNTRPTSGTGGARVILKNAAGAQIATKDFPYYTNIPDWNFSISSNQKVRIFVGPVTSGQTVVGNLVYSFK